MNRMFRFALLIVLLLMPGQLLAESYELVPFWGYRFGGDFDDVANPLVRDLEVGEDDAYGVSFNVWLSDNQGLEVLWSHQPTDLTIDTAFIFGGTSTQEVGLDVDNWHIGGFYAWGDSSAKSRPFVSYSLGATHFDAVGFSSETKFSFSLGGGLRWNLSKSFGLRVHGRWTPTYINSSSEGVFCDVFGCYEITDSHYLYQTELGVGVVISFGGQ